MLSTGEEQRHPFSRRIAALLAAQRLTRRRRQTVLHDDALLLWQFLQHPSSGAGIECAADRRRTPQRTPPVSPFGGGRAGLASVVVEDAPLPGGQLLR